MSKPVEVFIVDDHAMFRETLRERLDREPDLTVTGDFPCAADAVTEVTQGCSPDVIVMDIDMPGQSSFDATKQIQALRPETHIIFVSAFHHDHYIGQALAVRASGYVTKGEPVDSIINAIRAAMRGERTFSPTVAERIIVDESGTHLATGTSTLSSKLSDREIEMLQYLARGLSPRDIATAANISEHTVIRHSKNIMNKLDIHNRVELVRYAIREGLADA